jgi:asparagine synthase (glutamine-hydrolysing)
MCGFVAVVSRTRIAPATLDRMRDRVAHRGPDGGQSWIERLDDSWLGFGHRRLSIIDLSHAADQPMFSRDRQTVLNYNGEIYNYVELRAELEKLGRIFATRSDTEVLLQAYEQWGPDCVGHLNGMFSFVVWDAHSKQLFAARDRFGEKPLFYASLPSGGIAIGSEMKALFAHDDLEARQNPEVVTTYVDGGYYEDGEDTMFAGVKRLSPAHALLIDQQGTITRKWRYWTPDYTSPQIGYNEREAVDRFRELFARSVQMRLRSDVPVGTSLSGGLDSSLIVCTLSGLRATTPVLSQKTFSGRFDGVDETLSEGPQIDAVVARSGVEPYAVSPDPLRLVEELRSLHWHQEEPFLSASIYLQWCVMRLAAQNDTTVLLDGQGADEVLAGYQFYFKSYQLDLVDRRRLIKLYLETSRFRRRLHHASRSYESSQRRFDRDIAPSFRALLPSLRTRMGLYGGPYTVGVPPIAHGMRLRRQIAEALQYNSLPMLLRYADRNAMAFSRETRFPFLDYDFVDWCISLPDKAYVNNGWQKYLLRQAGEGVLPPEIQWRADKVGYAAPLDLWLRGPLKDWAYRMLFAGRIVDVPGYDAASLRGLWDDHQDRRTNNSWPLWRWISLEEWLGLLDDGCWRQGLR